MTDDKDILGELKFCAVYHDRMGMLENARLFKAAAEEIERLRAERAAMAECLRVNLLRHVPGITHADIDAKIAEIAPGEEGNEHE